MLTMTDVTVKSFLVEWNESENHLNILLSMSDGETVIVDVSDMDFTGEFAIVTSSEEVVAKAKTVNDAIETRIQYKDLSLISRAGSQGVMIRETA